MRLLEKQPELKKRRYKFFIKANTGSYADSEATASFDVYSEHPQGPTLEEIENAARKELDRLLVWEWSAVP